MSKEQNKKMSGPETRHNHHAPTPVPGIAPIPVAMSPVTWNLEHGTSPLGTAKRSEDGSPICVHRRLSAVKTVFAICESRAFGARFLPRKNASNAKKRFCVYALFVPFCGYHLWLRLCRAACFVVKTQPFSFPHLCPSASICG
jgi:hypothetical protein